MSVCPLHAASLWQGCRWISAWAMPKWPAHTQTHARTHAHIHTLATETRVSSSARCLSVALSFSRLEKSVWQNSIKAPIHRAENEWGGLTQESADGQRGLNWSCSLALCLSLSATSSQLKGDYSKSQVQLLLCVALNEPFSFTVFIPWCFIGAIKGVQ